MMTLGAGIAAQRDGRLRLQGRVAKGLSRPVHWGCREPGKK